MLQKFLFVGLGGSGGKTLRFLYEMLGRRLEEAGHTGGMPGGWQFVQADVPVVADGTRPDLPDQLPPQCYVGMAPRGLTYRDLDDLLLQRGPAVIEHTAGWRPRPDRVGVDPSAGAGQYRAVGRAITAAAITKVVPKLQQAVNALEDVTVNEELSDLSLRLTGRSGVSDRYPQPVIVASIAGGSGAGSLLDVCDALRGLAPEWGDKTAAVLFLPDVFSDVPQANKAGITPNALATISEIMAGYWSDGSYPNEYAILESAGVPVPSDGRRGPRYPLLVGRSNGDVQFSTQTEVYRAAARALTAWTVDDKVQDSVSASVFGNWSNTAESRPDATRMTNGEGLEVPFSAFGFASVGLGRSRFARYAAERLARDSVEQLLRGHWTEDVPQRKTDEEAAAERADEVLYQFLERCGLREYGPQHNQIIDAIRGGVEAEAREADKQQLRSQVRRRVVRAEDEADKIRQRVLTEIRDNWEPFIDEQAQADLERARAWFRTTQDAITHETARLLGQEGAPVTARVLDLASRELAMKVVPELREMGNAATTYASHNDQRISSAFAGHEGTMLGENPLIDKGVQEGVNSLHAEAEAHLYDLCAQLAQDLSDNCLRPLRDAVRRAEDGLRSAEAGTPELPSVVKSWPQGPVPQSHEPAQNERLLEPTSSYPDTYRELLRSSTGSSDLQGGLLAAIRQVVAGEGVDEDEPPAAVVRTGDWVPRDDVLRSSSHGRSAQFRVDVTPAQLLSRARAWVHRPESAIGEHVSESLRVYLSPDEVNPQEHAQRLERFKSALSGALTASRPLIDVDRSVEAKVHGSTASDAGRHLEVSTPFPFPTGHPGRAVVREVFHHVDQGQLDKMFDDTDRARIEIASFLSAPCHAVAFNSLTEPINGDWAKAKIHPNLNGFWDRRRARSLPQFIPAAPDHVRAMIRGWFVARMLNHIRVADVNHEPVTIWTAAGPAAFPHPLLTSPLTGMQELLPGILESLPLALMGPTESSMRPYWQLITLGTDDPTWYSGTREDEDVHDYLKSWIEQGTTPKGAPDPLVGGADASVDERLKEALDFIDRYLAEYGELASMPIDAKSALDVSGTWELRHLIVTQLESLRALAQDMTAVSDEGVW